ncbi:MAG: PAS domain S-box protein [Candidatus Rokubacteria bacterium]|nr:PAS domain S-box protein [Candidatus Rokubacteria bacterium]
MSVPRLIERLARHVGGTRVLALPMIRALAVISGYAWVLLAPEAFAGWDAVDTTMLGFLTYSLAVIGALWLRPGTMLRLNVLVLFVDLAFALTLIHLTGGARSTLFLALLLIAGLQSYYYGISRGVLVALGSALAYVWVVWPTVAEIEWANMAIRLSVLLGTAIGVGILADIEEGERHQVLALSAEAREREQFVRSVVETLSEGIVALDREGRVVAWNRAMERRYAVAAAEVMGRKFFEFFPSALREPWGESFARLLGGEIEEFTLEAVEHETLRVGRVVQNLKASLLRRNGQPAGAVLLIEDITTRIALERAARQAEKLAALGTLAAGLAHELNNPIGIMSSRIELMLLDTDPRLPEEVREDLGVVHRHAQRVARIVQGLLSFARQTPAERAPLDLNQLVEDTLLLVEKQVLKENVRLVRKLSPGLPPIWADATGVQQVLMNLLLNAREAMDGPGEIVIETDVPAERAQRVRLVVRDTGPGIPPEILSKIFDPFFTTKPHGTGLGLAISYGIVRDHQGTVDVQSEPGKGTTFVLTFPASSVEVEA